MKKRNIAIIFGGCSPEYSVSLESAASILEHLDLNRYRPILLGITRDGQWLYYTGEVEKIGSDSWNSLDNCAPSLISPDKNSRTLFVFQKNGDIQKIRLDAAFPVLHGKNGEDGTVQGLLELAGIPLIGCGVLASALCMDKYRAHKLAQAAGIKTPKSVVLKGPPENLNIKQVLASAEKLGYPVFVKPVRAGSSYGISKVVEPEALSNALELAFAYDDEILLEETISGFEVGCAILGNESLKIGELDEIELTNGYANYFDYTEKYTLKTSQIHVPARISQEKTIEIKKTAQLIYRLFGCQGFARIDLFLDHNGNIFLNEVNTIPGFTAHSRYPSMMRAAGISLSQMISEVIELAVNN